MNILEYPLNSKVILRKKTAIKKELLLKNGFIEKKIAILGGSTTSEITKILELFLLNNGIKPNFYESEYNRYYEDAIFNEEALAKFNPDIVYIHTTNVNIQKFPDISSSNEDVEILINSEIDKFKSIWKAISLHNCDIIQNNFDLPFERELGNLDCYDIHGKTYFINQLNQQISLSARHIKNLYINDINYLSSYIGLQSWFDKSLWYQAKYALSMNSIPELSFNIAKIINSIFCKTKKCLVLDLDNTCWGGVISDDGLSGISIGTETAISESYTGFQKYIKSLQGRGVILAACSKNDFENAKEGFNHPDTILKFEDFSSFKANWNEKYKNIIEIVREVNIGLDSLVFIDDNPFERELACSQLPSLSVPDVGNNITEFINYIDRNGYFEPISFSIDDENRGKYYKDNKKRVDVLSEFTSYDDFLKSLEMVAEIKSFSQIYLNRITQLINKTNQFNLTTRRFTFSEVESIWGDDKFIKIYGKLSDKYGSNGLVSVIIGEVKSNVCHINLWVMSCRVIKRDLEFAMFDKLVKLCSNNKISMIVGKYYESTKNNLVSDLYKKLGFTLRSKDNNDSIWELDISNYKNKNKNNIIRINI